jgi:hypothetical protein
MTDPDFDRDAKHGGLAQLGPWGVIKFILLMALLGIVALMLALSFLGDVLGVILMVFRAVLP